MRETYLKFAEEFEGLQELHVTRFSLDSNTHDRYQIIQNLINTASTILGLELVPLIDEVVGDSAPLSMILESIRESALYSMNVQTMDDEFIINAYFQSKLLLGCPVRVVTGILAWSESGVVRVQITSKFALTQFPLDVGMIPPHLLVYQLLSELTKNPDLNLQIHELDLPGVSGSTSPRGSIFAIREADGIDLIRESLEFSLTGMARLEVIDILSWPRDSHNFPAIYFSGNPRDLPIRFTKRPRVGNVLPFIANQKILARGFVSDLTLKQLSHSVKSSGPFVDLGPSVQNKELGLAKAKIAELEEVIAVLDNKNAGLQYVNDILAVSKGVRLSLDINDIDLSCGYDELVAELDKLKMGTGGAIVFTPAAARSWIKHCKKGSFDEPEMKRYILALAKFAILYRGSGSDPNFLDWKILPYPPFGLDFEPKDSREWKIEFEGINIDLRPHLRPVTRRDGETSRIYFGYDSTNMRIVVNGMGDHR